MLLYDRDSAVPELSFLARFSYVKILILPLRPPPFFPVNEFVKPILCQMRCHGCFQILKQKFIPNFCLLCCLQCEVTTPKACTVSLCHLVIGP